MYEGPVLEGRKGFIGGGLHTDKGKERRGIYTKDIGNIRNIAAQQLIYFAAAQ